jgi:predicted N-acetyltransferase YhbS
MSEKTSFLLRVQTDEDRIAVIKLLGDTFKVSPEFCMWKHELNPYFDPSLSRVAVDGKQVVGCHFWLPQNLKISNSLSVRAALGEGLAVSTSHKGRGIAKALVASENQVLENKNFVMSFGFIPAAELVKHVHGPQLGLVSLPTSTIVCTKYFDCSKIKEKVQLMNRIVDSDQKIREKLANLKVNVLFHLRGFPPFVIKIGPSTIDMEEDLTHFDVKVQSDLTRLDLVRSKRKMLTLIKSLFMRQLRINGSLRNIIKLYSILELLKLLFA